MVACGIAQLVALSDTAGSRIGPLTRWFNTAIAM